MQAFEDCTTFTINGDNDSFIYQLLFEVSIRNMMPPTNPTLMNFTDCLPYRNVNVIDQSFLVTN